MSKIPKPMKTSELLNVAQAAQLKKVSRSAIYLAVQSGRLPYQRVLGHIGIEKADLKAWTPVGHRAGRPKGIPMGQEAKERISETQKANWASGKRQAKKSNSDKSNE